MYYKGHIVNIFDIMSQALKEFLNSINVEQIKVLNMILKHK